jgi:TonB family protein
MAHIRFVLAVLATSFTLVMRMADPPQDMPRVKQSVNPVYPAVLKAAGIEGTVYVTAKVNEKGGIDSVVAVKSSHPDFIPATIEAVKQWTFMPAMKDGKPIKAEVTIPFRFALAEGKSGAEALMKLKDSAVQLLQGKSTDDFVSHIDPEANIVIGGKMENLLRLVKDKEKRSMLVEGPESKLDFSQLRTSDKDDSAYLLLRMKPGGAKADRFHTVVFFKSKSGEWKIYSWQTSAQ